MKKMYTLAALTAISLTVAGCGNAEEDQAVESQAQNQEIENKPVEIPEQNQEAENKSVNSSESNVNDSNQNIDASSQENMRKKINELNYTDFELKVEYNEQKEYEVELEQHKHDQSVTAEIEDSLNGVNKRGVDAFNDIYPKVKQLTINQQTSKNDAIKEVLNVFGLSPDYAEFELDLTFKDGTKIELEDKK
ncbi:YusW family protein [Bacillus aerolatus]|nr:YusW family protein [Bacillus aerolatus]